MVITAQHLITGAAVLTAALALLGYYNRAYNWYQKQQRQDEDIRALKEEQGILTYGVLACLKGLKEQGCNGPVSEAIAKIEKHLNRRAHE